MLRETAVASAWVLSEESCEASWKSLYSREQSCSSPVRPHARDQGVSGLHSPLELLLQQSLTDTDGLKGESVFISTWVSEKKA